MTGRLLGLGLIAGPLFTATYLVLGVVHGDGYSAVRHPISSLALGPHGWAQVASFLTSGLLLVLFAAGLRRGLGSVALPALVAAGGVGLAGAGIFLSDDVGAPITWHGRLHNEAFSLPGFAALTLAMLVAAVVFAGRFAVYSAVSGLVFAALFVVAILGFTGSAPWAAAPGLLQRLCISVGWLWVFLLARHVDTGPRRRATDGRRLPPGRRPAASRVHDW
ncbi:DUF998 domain-containing protein [Actinoplanes sp. NBRC 103695]|uniref:DUF998 domain-containing protein n=1 Tax=Actinoplanes sp. NBRC 103695 TaxID=3032202 RepID=UPI0024A4E9F7|nr:DUF998 domain-containing protein [Actinoplanes sp. NBRC 103695]GLY93572.1 hypothetical protein Acsp02_08280 [Actinoplanes sp. NBRC 103695]